jgi:hypothetical protein
MHINYLLCIMDIYPNIQNSVQNNQKFIDENGFMVILD